MEAPSGGWYRQRRPQYRPARQTEGIQTPSLSLAAKSRPLTPGLRAEAHPRGRSSGQCAYVPFSCKTPGRRVTFTITYSITSFFLTLTGS